MMFGLSHLILGTICENLPKMLTTRCMKWL